jgi:hypothetical protein
VNFARLVDRGINIIILVFFLLLGFGVIGRKRSLRSKTDVERKPRQVLSKLAIALAITGAVLTLLLYWSAMPVKPVASESLVWQTVTTNDGALRVKMPGKPEVAVTNKDGELGPTRAVKQVVEIYDHSVIITIYERHYLDKDVHFDNKEFLNSMVQTTVAQSKGKTIRERDIRRGDLEGKEISLSMPQDYTVVMQGFFSGRSLYQLKIVVPNAMVNSPFVQQYFDSLRVDLFRAAPSGGSAVDGESAKSVR